MLTSRCVADRFVTSRPAISMRPSLGSSSPAIMRSVVVLPQPDGPNKVTSVPLSTVKLIPATAGVVP